MPGVCAIRAATTGTRPAVRQREIGCCTTRGRGGFAQLAVERRWLRRHFEAEARRLPFGECSFGRAVLSIAPFLAIVGLTVGILYLAQGPSAAEVHFGVSSDDRKWWGLPILDLAIWRLTPSR